MKTPIVMRVTASAAAAIGLFLPPTVVPSYATGDTVVLNASGGTSAAGGLKLQAADGVVQITRAGQPQVMNGVAVPAGGFAPAELLQNTFLVLETTPVATVIGLNTKLTAPGMLMWDSAITSVSTADGKSGTVTSVMTKDLDGNPATTNDVYTVTWALKVAQSSPTLVSTFNVTMPSGSNGSPKARLYWATTPDLGNGQNVLTTFGAVLMNNPNVVLTALTPTVTESGDPLTPAVRGAQAVHQVVGATKFRWFIGSTYCLAGDCIPVSDDPQYGAPADNDGNAGGWVMRGADLPNWANTFTVSADGVGVDNALAIQFPATKASARFQNQWTLTSVTGMTTVLNSLKRVAPTYKAAPKTLKAGKSVVVVTKVGFPAVTLVSTTPKTCTVSGAKVVAAAKGTCVVKAKVEGVAVKTITLTISR